MTAVQPAEPFYGSGEHFAIDLPGARALFTTRRGGFSRGPFASLNLSALTEDEPSAVQSNRRRLEDKAGHPVSFVRQVHGTALHELSSPVDQDQVEADGQVTVTPGVAAAALAADCLPVVIAGGGGVAVLHAGWPGLEAGIIAAGLERLRSLGVTGSLAAAIGPSAGPCCYEVGDELREAFAAYPQHVRPGRNLDLPGIARVQLERGGVEQVHVIGLCTICSDPSLLFSHRRDRGMTGRQAGLAWLT